MFRKYRTGSRQWRRYLRNGTLAARAVSEAQLATDAAPGIRRVDAEAVNAKAAREFYATRKKIYPKLAFGTFRNIKWLVMAVALGIYYVLPWIRWPRAEGLPDQAFLVDFAHQRIFLGPIEIWPQEFYIITGILVVAALALFLMTALIYLVPIALALGFAALAAFLWSLKSGQFEDLEGAGWRVLDDDVTMEHAEPIQPTRAR